MARDDYLDHLAAVPLFARCNKNQLQEIARVADEINVPAGKVIAQEGAVGSELFVILSGTAVVTHGGEKVATIGKGEFAGELAVLARTPRNATVTAESDLDVLVLTPSGLSQLLDDIPGLAKHLLYEVVERLAPSADDHSR